MVPFRDIDSVLDAILEGLQVLGPDWRYLHINDAAAKHGRSTKDQLLGKTILECYPGIENTPVFACMRQCMNDRTSHVLENEFTFPDGTVGYFELHIAPVPQGICVLSIDVTARKEAEMARARAEERLRQAERLEAIGCLATGIAHDFNNLLTVMISQAELGITSETGPTREDLEVILSAARSSAELTQQLLAYGRRAALTPEIVDAGDVVRGLEPILRRGLESRIELVVEVDRPMGMVAVDRIRLEQIVMNLVLNAREAIPEPAAGRITLQLRGANPEDEGGAAAAGPVSHVLLAVSDTGTGIDAETRPRIFDPYFTTKEHRRGTGLGLATVSGIVHQYGGTIRVYSEPGRGSRFEVFLPSTTGERVAVLPAVGPKPTAATHREATILVQSFVPEIGGVIARILRRDKHRVLVASGREQLLEVFAEHRERIDLLITDIAMRDLCEPDLLGRLRAQRPGLRVLCTSSTGDPRVDDALARREDIAFLAKPFTPAELLMRVNGLLSPRVEGGARAEF